MRNILLLIVCLLLIGCSEKDPNIKADIDHELDIFQYISNTL